MFKYAIIPFLLILMFSCGKPQDAANVESISYIVDSVAVDSKGHIFDLQYSMLKSDYSQEDGVLYNYNGYEHSIEMIDLDRLEFAGRFPLQVEGPDGTGSRVYTVKSMGNEKLFLAGQLAGVFTLAGKLVKKFEWNNISSNQGGIAAEEFIYQYMAIPGFDHLAFALVTDHIANRASLKMLNSKDEVISTYEIDPNRNYKTYTLGDLTNFNNWTPTVFLSSEQDKIIVSHEFANDFYVYSPDRDHVETVAYSSTYTPSKVTITTEGDFINSTEDRIGAAQYYREQVSFGPLVWDPQNKRYYRLSSSSTFGEEKRGDRILHETTSVDVYLSVFDQEFNLIGEMPLPQLNNQSSAKYFVKDGMLWIFENRDDEMGFVRVIFE
ncbi:DUF4221 family protein [Lunatibacter salilacus]|uniref:DUF4221 family protein n=1 Tax=Lunatibacter salilacus TaxID=2483804 RepID=UPI00131BC787|nr:DUF4221 family protein [Lunatibacter salilacus]